MRAIKFRAWNPSLKRFTHFPAYVLTGDWEDKMGLFFKASDPFYLNADTEPIQFTGLSDKKGKEIYEGDIVAFSVFDHNGNDTQYKGCIMFACSEWQIWKTPADEFYGSDGAFHFGWVCAQDEEIEIIGNIYETPDLLKC